MPSRTAKRERLVLKPVVRPLREAERRILRWGVIRQRRCMTQLAPLMTLAVGLVLFGGLWGLSILATKADKKGPSWQMSGLIWLAIGIPISLWSHRDLRRHAAKYEGSCASALKMDRAVEIQIRSDAVAVFEAGAKQGPAYAFQVGDNDMVLIAYEKAHPSARFPNADFSLVDLFTEQKKPAVGLLEKRGKKIEPVRKIPSEMRARLKMTEHLSVVQGKLSEIESLRAPESE
jgi:hypothetical protein